MTSFILKYVLARMAEASTWRGFVLLFTGLTVAQQDSLVGLGLAVAGVVGAFLPDKLLAASK